MAKKGAFLRIVYILSIFSIFSYVEYGLYQKLKDIYEYNRINRELKMKEIETNYPLRKEGFWGGDKN
ncbi:MAG: hypothetical protein RR191_01595 [Cetobacterium sp.]|uniref:hypothetical protein n=1 Tax=unclassified Cetobacterium TaxID=2630983 RepID=UPI00163CE77F|nr:hypothetical protein [Cetobacterium sp. 2A]MBC2855742.1 hypothetical protein [Cetobacterium sp. 2A]